MAQAVIDIQKSTTGRSLDLEWKRIQLLVGASVSTSLAERTAARLFMTPHRLSRPEAENELLSRARAFRVDGLAAWRWGSGPPVLLVHGWEGRGAQLGTFVAPLTSRGFSVVAFDAPAHGASPGLRANIADFADAVSSVSRRLGAPRAIVGHSLGALAGMLAVRRGVSAMGLVTIAPPSLAERLAAFQNALEVPESVRSGMRRRVEHAVGASFDDVEGSALARDLNVPGLVLHDVHDRDAPFRISEDIAAVWPRATLHSTDGLGHRHILHDASVAKKIASFVEGLG